mmetsp:Transcript_30344/g.73816  ORF Transcript_30344/g.73816 Transcript_30344/m.73816 type:complete len:407 (-) Transcript_30344:42-1262(-)
MKTKKVSKAQRVLDETQRLDKVLPIVTDKNRKEVIDITKQQLKLEEDLEKRYEKEFQEQVKHHLEAGWSLEELKHKFRRPVAFYIVFDGDVMVSGLELLRKQISLVVHLADPTKGDICVINLTSPGGAVSQYGLAASQLVRIRKVGIPLTVLVDTIAASGGYMMASVADRIIAAPFAVVGSIGVVTQIPNIQRFLEYHNIDAYLMTAGDYKRTIDLIGDVTEEGKAKLKEQLTDIHVAFKDHIAFLRPALLRDNKIDEVATGEHWLAVEAKSKGLVDGIMTSDEYLESLCRGCDWDGVCACRSNGDGDHDVEKGRKGDDDCNDLGSGGYDIIELLQKYDRPRPSLSDFMSASFSSAASSAIQSMATSTASTPSLQHIAGHSTASAVASSLEYHSRTPKGPTPMAIV